MAAVRSTMLPLGTSAPPFSLPDTDGNTVSLDEFAGAPALLVVFMCPHCPYVKLIRQGLADLAREYTLRGVGIVGIMSNDVDQYPQDSPQEMRREKEEAGYPFPYLYDESQAVARAYQAACTPDIFVFDGERKLVYRGQFDDARPGGGRPVTGRDLRDALNAVLDGREVSAEQTPSIGCNIKWKPGNAPTWFG